MISVLVTGGNGFVGSVLCVALSQCGYNVTAALHRDKSAGLVKIRPIMVGEINGQTDWSSVLPGIDVIIHLAARVHVMLDTALNPLAEFCRINTDGTENLARSAAVSGVKRFVYVSSIKVNGEETPDGGSFSELDMPSPQDAYGISKWEAEQALHRIAKETGLEVSIVRPPLVYGAGVKGNFLQMMNVIARNLPLPLGSVKNQRDLIYVGNLVDALITCATHPAAAGQTYLVSDGDSVSTPDLIRNLAKALGRPCLAFPFPIFMMKFLATLVAKSSVVDRLTQSLQIDSSKIRNELGWKPPFTMQQGLQATADWYLREGQEK